MNIYYSRSNEVEDHKIDPLLEMFCQNLPNKARTELVLMKHRRGSTYDPDILDGADLVLVGVTDLDSSLPEIAKGCYSEILRALNLNIPVAVFFDDEELGICIQTITTPDIKVQDVGTYQLGYARLNIYDELESVIDENSDHHGCDIKNPQFVEDFLVQIYGLDKFNELFHPEYNDIKQELSKREVAVVNGTTFHIKIGSDKTLPTNKLLLLLG